MILNTFSKVSYCISESVTFPYFFYLFMKRGESRLSTTITISPANRAFYPVSKEKKREKGGKWASRYPPCSTYSSYLTRVCLNSNQLFQILTNLVSESFCKCITSSISLILSTSLSQSFIICIFFDFHCFEIIAFAAFNKNGVIARSVGVRRSVGVKLS